MQSNNTNSNLIRGNQGKFCIDGKFYKADEYGYEAAAEYLTSEILRVSNISDFVDYKIIPNLYNQRGTSKHCCVSDDFMGRFPNGREITIADLLQRLCDSETLKEITDPDSKYRSRHSLAETISRIVDIISEQTNLSDFGGYLTAVLELDALTRNDDRHYNNISFIQFPNGLWKIAPVFDNGSAFGARDKDPTTGGVYGTNVPWIFNEARYYKIPAMPFSSKFEKQIKACRDLYGPRLQILDSIDLEPAFDHISSIYGKEVANRMKSVWNISLQKHPEMFVPRITAPAYSSEQTLKLGL